MTTILSYITEDLKKGEKLDHVLKKYKTNLNELFNKPTHKNYDQWTYIRITPAQTYTVIRNRTSYGTYNTHQEALTVRNQLARQNWDKKRLPDILKTYNIKLTKGSKDYYDI